MGLLGGLLGQLVVQLPMLVVLIVGGVLLLGRRDRMTRRAATVGLLGIGLLLLSALADTVWFTAFPFVIRSAGLSSFTLLSFAAGFVLALLHAAGIGALVMALLATAAPAPGFPTAPGFPGGAPYPGAPGFPGPYPPQAAPGGPGGGQPGQQGWGGFPQQNWNPPPNS